MRVIKPSIWGDSRFAGLPLEARLLTIGLISNADDAGRFIATPAAIAGAVYPHDDIPFTKIRRWRDQVADAGLIELYRVAGREYGHFPRWRRHQRIDKPQPSSLPAPDPDQLFPIDATTDSASRSQNHSTNDSRSHSGTKRKGREEERKQQQPRAGARDAEPPDDNSGSSSSDDDISKALDHTGPWVLDVRRALDTKLRSSGLPNPPITALEAALREYKTRDHPKPGLVLNLLQDELNRMAAEDAGAPHGADYTDDGKWIGWRQ